MLQSLGIQCDMAISGEIALEMLEQRSKAMIKDHSVKRIAMILIDFEMPLMDGPTTAQKIVSYYKRASYLLETPTICCMTGHLKGMKEAEAELAGMTEFICKPADKTVLKSLMKKYRVIDTSEK